MPAVNNNTVRLIVLSKIPQLVTALNLIFHHDGWITTGHTAASAMAALLLTLKSKHVYANSISTQLMNDVIADVTTDDNGQPLAVTAFTALQL